jgi:hypothetical protein
MPTIFGYFWLFLIGSDLWHNQHQEAVHTLASPARVKCLRYGSLKFYVSPARKHYLAVGLAWLTSQIFVN